MIQVLPTYHGFESEQANLHIREFEDGYAIFSDQNCSKDTIKLKLFPFFLKDKAKSWFISLRLGLLTRGKKSKNNS